MGLDNFKNSLVISSHASADKPSFRNAIPSNVSDDERRGSHTLIPRGPKALSLKSTHSNGVCTNALLKICITSSPIEVSLPAIMSLKSANFKFFINFSFSAATIADGASNDLLDKRTRSTVAAVSGVIDAKSS